FKSSTDATSATVQWQGEHGRIGASQSYDRLETGLPGALTADEYAADPAITNFPLDKATITNRRGSLFGELDLGNWQLGLDYGDRDKSLRSINFGFPYDYDIDAHNLSLRARHGIAFGAAKNALAFGFDAAEWQRQVAGGSHAEQKSR